MKRYMERIWELMNDPNAKNNVPLYDETLPKGVSFDQLRIITGRVYAYLKARNIGKEDFVLIKLPRGVQPIIAMLGVWRAGAALVMAGLAAEGFSMVDDIHYIQRGYEDFELKLQSPGAQIEKVESDREIQKFKLKVG